MIGLHRHVLYVAEGLDYEPRLQTIIEKLQRYRSGEGIDWRARVEAWLSNFDGFHDQRVALDMLERLRVVAQADLVEGCRCLIAMVREGLPGNNRVLHFAHESSGGPLIRTIEKYLHVRNRDILRHADFTMLEGKLRDGDVVVIWDTFNGTGGQLRKQIRRYKARFEESSKRIGRLCFAYVAGHPPAEAPPEGVAVLRWITDVFLMTEEEREVCSRYAAAAGRNKTNQKHETGALITFADNPPNNIPLVLRARANKTWFTLLDRKDTAVP